MELHKLKWSRAVMKVGDLVKLKHCGDEWGIGVLTEYRPVLGCWWVHWSNMGRCFLGEHRLEVINESR